MADENISLYDLLNLSISSPRQGLVNFRAMYTLLHSILRQLGIRDITVSFSDTSPGESTLEPQTEEGEPRSRTGEPRETDPPETGQGTTQESVGNDKHFLELIQRIEKQTDQLQDNVRELRHQQDKASAAQSQWVKTLESHGQRVDALEEAVRVPEEDERYVTWEAMKSALITERQNLQKGLIQTMKDEDMITTEPNTSDVSPSSKTQTKESRTETEAKDDPGPGSARVRTLTQKACGSFMYQETVEALKNIGRLKQRCDGLEERLCSLDLERSRERQELLRLRDLLHNTGSDEAFDAMKEELDEQRALVQSLLSERDKSAQLVSGVQKTILQLQTECEKLHETTRCLHEDNQQKQAHIEELYKMTEELEEKKANKNIVETEIRADKSVLDSKVSRVQFDSVTEQLSNMFNDLLTKVTDREQDWSKLMEKLSTEMDRKLNRIELDSMKKQLEDRWKTIQERMKNEGALEQDDAAGIRKQLVERFHCLSCDRPVVKHTPGPQLLTLPASPSFQPHRSLRPFTVYMLEQIRQHCRSERVVEVADYSLYSVSRSCGGSHTVTSFNQRQRSTVQHSSQQSRLLAQIDDTFGQSVEVDILGVDGNIYKGRLNATPSKNMETKLPTIASKDGSYRSRGRPRSSPSPRESAPSSGLQRPSPPSGMITHGYRKGSPPG
ncbi:glutamine-rich protein 2 [Periophthalmus magnuspinnatus]|uniref:glutamine-rich protein 2 n=1 Tax=Periophthalmus magnuspinnatus TaxID=409849 RepID=UPI002436A2FD|nr:glutamine-rich protein 2 [Periophthalmus magnuspinnatus]